MVMRLDDPATFDRLKARVEGDPRLQVEVERESQFFADQAALLTSVLRFIAIFVTAIMAFGAVFGAINTMDAMVAARGREIALLRTLGFHRRSIMASFLVESLLVAFAGGLLGCLLSLPINGIQTSTTNWQSFGEMTFAFRVTPESMLAGIGFALAMGLVGGLLPAWRAARSVVAVGLRRG
jgi:ABC-type lipoprotein release transport system permease subunit